MRNLISMSCAVLIAATVVMPAMAKDWNDRDYHRGSNWNNSYNRNNNWNRRHRHAARRVAHDWNWERGQYYNNWNRVSLAQQRRYDAQMRQQWLAYKHNNWNGAYTWSNYRDPGFINYLHTSNPGLLTQLRTVIGF